MVTKCGAGLEEATKKKLVEDEARRNVARSAVDTLGP